jgi:DNA repair protein RadC
MSEKTPIITPAPNAKQLLAPLYHLELVKDRDIPYDGSVKTTEQAAQVLHTLLDRSPTERFAVVYLSSAAEIIGAEVVSMGGMESVHTNHSEVFRGALVHAAPEVLLCHNHPSGEVEPSTQDLLMTMSTISLGGALGVRVRDHIIVGPNGKHLSIRENMPRLEEKLRKAEEEMFDGIGLGGIKSKILDLLKSKGVIPENAKVDLVGPFDVEVIGGPGTKKGGGDPEANTNTDLLESLSYKWLNR